MGETLNETVRRLRLHRASYRLVRTQLPITKIAHEAGYGSIAAFNRAFAATFDMPPVAWRKARVGRQNGLEILPANKELSAMLNVQVVELPAIHAAILNHTGPYDTLGSSFQNFSALAHRQNLFDSESEMIAVYLDDPATVATSKLRSQIGATVAVSKSIEPPLEMLNIPTCRAGFYRHIGPYALIGPAWAAFYRDWLAPSGEVPADIPCFELYRNDPRSTKPSELITDMYIPLQG